jgi:hypothetical protein
MKFVEQSCQRENCILYNDVIFKSFSYQIFLHSSGKKIYQYQINLGLYVNLLRENCAVLVGMGLSQVVQHFI